MKHQKQAVLKGGQMKNLLLCVLLMLGVNQVFARDFYQSEFKATLHYSNIEQGTRVIFKNTQVIVRYSNDHDFCQLHVGKERIPCKTFHPSTDAGDAKITMDRGPAKELVLALIHSADCSHKLKKKLERLLPYLTDTINLEYIGTDFYQEVHDEQTEVFHLWLFELTEGKKLLSDCNHE